jgi:ADP-ribose pyrophosphatase YjhB (NUDIX family)
MFRSGKVLLVKRGKPPFKGLWSLPGGGVEPGESMGEAALREAMEETGLKPVLLGVSGFAEIAPLETDASSFQPLALTIFAALAEGEAEPIAASDAAAVLWAGFSDLPALAMTPDAQRHVETAWAIASRRGGVAD